MKSTDFLTLHETNYLGNPKTLLYGYVKYGRKRAETDTKWKVKVSKRNVYTFLGLESRILFYDILFYSMKVVCMAWGARSFTIIHIYLFFLNPPQYGGQNK